MRHNAKDAVPVQFEIDRARDDIAALEPAIKDNIEVLARAEVEVEHLDREIVATRERWIHVSATAPTTPTSAPIRACPARAKARMYFASNGRLPDALVALKRTPRFFPT